MALVFTSLAAMSTDTSQATSYAGTAGSPASGDLLICGVQVSGAPSPTVPGGTMTGGGWTWNLLYDFSVTASYNIRVFWAVTTGTTSTTPTYDCTGDQGTGACIHCWRVTGGDGTAQPYLRQFSTRAGTIANPGCLMDTAILAGSGCISFVGNNTNAAAQWTNPTSWATDIENTYNTPATSFASSSRASGETGSTITWTNANTTQWGIVVLEFYVLGAGKSPQDDTGATGFFGVNTY